LLIDVSQTTTTIETIFAEAGLNESEFLFLLKAALGGHEINHQRIMEIAAMISPHLVVPRGAKLRTGSAAHELFLNPDFGLAASSRRSAHRNHAGEYVSSVTAATRLEFGMPDFDPRPAQRRTKRPRKNSTPKRS